MKKGHKLKAITSKGKTLKVESEKLGLTSRIL